MEFSRQEYYSGLPFPTLGALLTQGLNTGLLYLLYRRQILYCLSHKRRPICAVLEVLAKVIRQEKEICSIIDSVQFSSSVVSDSLWPHGLQQTRPPCPSPTPRVYSNSCPLSRWCRQTISSSVVFFSSCAQSFPASGSFPMSQFFASGGQSIGVSASASVLPMSIQDWFPVGWTGWISLRYCVIDWEGRNRAVFVCRWCHHLHRNTKELIKKPLESNN